MFQYPPLSYNNCKRQIQNFIISNEIEQETTRITCINYIKSKWERFNYYEIIKAYETL